MSPDAARLRLVLVSCLTVLATPAVRAQDTTIIAADNPPVWGERLRLIEDHRIGTLDGPEEYLFGRVAAVAARPSDGMVFVLDAQVPIIRQYDADGRFVRNVGRDGEGPGEYREVMGMKMLPDGRLAIWDIGNGRVTVYDSSGAYAESHRVGSGLHASEAFAVDDAGNFYVRAFDWTRRTATPTRDPAQVLIKLSPSGDSLGAIPRPPSADPPSFMLTTPEGDRAPFPDKRLYALTRHGVFVIGHNRTYALDLPTPAGVRRIVRDVEPAAVGRGERAQWEAWADFFQRRARDAGQPTPDYQRVPDTKPFFRSLGVDADNRIWVGRYVEATRRDVEPRASGDPRPVYEWREPPTFDVIDADGTFLGTIVLPENTFVHQAQGLAVWGTVVGDMQEAYVVRFRIEPSR